MKKQLLIYAMIIGLTYLVVDFKREIYNGCQYCRSKLPSLDDIPIIGSFTYQPKFKNGEIAKCKLNNLYCIVNDYRGVRNYAEQYTIYYFNNEYRHTTNEFHLQKLTPEEVPPIEVLYEENIPKSEVTK